MYKSSTIIVESWESWEVPLWGTNFARFLSQLQVLTRLLSAHGITKHAWYLAKGPSRTAAFSQGLAAEIAEEFQECPMSICYIQSAQFFRIHVTVHTLLVIAASCFNHLVKHLWNVSKSFQPKQGNNQFEV